MDELLARLFGNQPTYAPQLLGEDQARALQQQAQQSGLLNVGLALLAGAGPSPQRRGVGELLAQGVMAGQQAYQGAYEKAVRDRMLQEQIMERQQARAEQQMAQAAQPLVFRPGAQTATFYGQPTQMATRDEYGNLFPGVEVKTGQPQLDINALLSLPLGVQQKLMPQASLAAELIPKLRKAGLTGEQGVQENPFAVFTQDPTLPPTIKTLASQYARSYASGQLEPEKADERVRQLGEMAQRVQQFQQMQASTESARAQSAAATAVSQGIQREMAELRKEAEANKPEQLSYLQKKEFDVVLASNDEAKKAESNASIAKTASGLVDKAYGGTGEAVFKNVVGAVGISTQAKEANDKLIRLSQQLALNTPKFSGPQSDRDVARYDAAVGDLGNPTKNPASKKAAIKDIIDLAEKASKFAKQQENYYYSNKKSLRGFEFNPYEGM